MTSQREIFYAERDLRTRQYGGDDTAFERPVRIVVDPEVARTRAGQVATLALVNMVARVHRRIHLEVPAGAPLTARGLVPADDLHAAAVASALAITPVLDLTTGPTEAPDAHAVSIGLGARVPSGLDLYLAWSGGRGSLATTPTTEDSSPDSSFGAAAAAVLGAAALFRLTHGQPVRPTRFNPIELTADQDAGTRDRCGAIDPGSVLVVGAGAVASGLAYWAREFGTHGAAWDFVDADLVELHNTNRCMTMTAAHAGWQHGVPGGQPAHKADAVAWAVEGRRYPQWYDEWLPEHQTRHDLVLPLANGRGVRALVAQRGEPVLLHATTSARWTAELHRHVPDRDGCPACRLPDDVVPRMTCATGPIDAAKPSSPDAALPFLSGAAGLLLAAALADMPARAVLNDRFNHWQFDLTAAEPMIQPRQHPPRDSCRHVQPASIRRAFQHHTPGRWDHLDTSS